MSRAGQTSPRLALAALAAAGVIGCAGDRIAHSDASAKPAGASVRLLDLDGRTVDLLEREQDHVAVVLFTRTDCPISNRFAPEIRHLHDLYGPRGVDFYLIYVDPEEQPDAIRKHLRDFGYRCPGLRDPNHKLVAFCSATVTPEAVVFGKDQTIVYRGRVCDQYVELGKAKPQPTLHDLADALESTVNGQPVATPRTRAIGCSIADLKE